MSDNKTLMIVDDSRVSRMMIKSIVSGKHPDWEIIEASESAEALAKSANQQIDYFTIDLNMPGIDGLELITQLQPAFTAATFVLLTANIQEATHNKCRELGVHCVNKPITEKSIAQILEYFNG